LSRREPFIDELAYSRSDRVLCYFRSEHLFHTRLTRRDAGIGNLYPHCRRSQIVFEGECPARLFQG